MGLFKVAIVLVLLFAMISRRVNLGIAMAVAAITLALLFNVAPLDIFATALQTSIDPTTLKLLAALLLIMPLRKAMDVQELVASLKGLARDSRVVAAVAPALIGLLPSAGGAYFSAPLVEEASVDMGLTAERKSFINYWYRHVSEYIWPLHTTFILASEVFHKPMRDMVIAQFPLTVVAVLAAIPFAFRGAQNFSGFSGNFDRRQYAGQMLVALSPILAILAMVLVFGVNIAIALAAVLLALLVVNKYSKRKMFELARETFSISILFLVLGVMFFNGMLAKIGVLKEASQALLALNFPMALLFFALPFVAGLLTGLTSAFAAVAFPVLGGFVGPSSVDPQLIALAFVGGVSGLLLSPAHLCLILTLQHFKANSTKVLSMVLVPQLLVVAVATLSYILF